MSTQSQTNPASPNPQPSAGQRTIWVVMKSSYTPEGSEGPYENLGTFATQRDAKDYLSREYYRCTTDELVSKDDMYFPKHGLLLGRSDEVAKWSMYVMSKTVSGNGQGG